VRPSARELLAGICIGENARKSLRRSGLAGVTLAVLTLAVMVLGYGSLFTVYQTQTPP